MRLVPEVGVCYLVPMGSLKQFSDPKELHVLYEQRICPGCGEDLRYGYCTSGRKIRRLEACYWVTAQTTYCRNGACPLIYKVLHPPAEWAMAGPYQGFGFDVMARVGRLRYGERLTSPQIVERLLREDKLVISERSVTNLYTLYGHLVSGEHLRDPDLIGEVKENRALVIGLDGGQPIKGHETVWFVRDLLSGQTLVAQAMRSTTAKDLIKLLMPVRKFAAEHGVPVIGIVSDGEKNARKAVKKVFPRVRHQLCQLHYVSNLAKPLVERDRTLRKELRKPFRELREIERSIPKDKALSPPQVHALEKLCLVVRSILKDNATAPFDPPGLKLYERLAELRKTVAEMAREKGGPVFGRWLISCRSWASSTPTSSGFATTTPTSGKSVRSSFRRVEPPRAPRGSFASSRTAGRRS
jgi:hypothetical protein